MGIVISVLAGYLFGSISSSIIISKAMYFKDIRKNGSGNAGATNMARVYGMSAGLLTLGCDMLKTALAGGVGWLLLGRLGLILACGACLIGHCWPAFYRFHGGKGVSVGAMIALLLDWRMLALLVLIFLIFAVISRRVSVGSLACALSFPLVYVLLGQPMDAGFYLCLLVMAVVIFCHRSNIGRLLRGEEPKFVPKKKR